MKLTPKARADLRMKFGGRCAYCGCELPEKGWHADHVKPVCRELKFARDKNDRTVMIATGKLYRPENDTAGNLFPTCRACNIDKGACELEAWREYLQSRIVDGLRRNSSTFRHAERFGRVVLTQDPLVFWFERFAGVQ